MKESTENTDLLHTHTHTRGLLKRQYKFNSMW